VMTRRLMLQLNKIRQIGTPWKVAGMIAAMILIGFSLQIDNVPPAVVGQPVRAGLARTDKNVFAAKGGLKSGDVNQPANLALGNLKLSDHLGE